MDSLLQSIRDDLLSLPIVSKDNTATSGEDIQRITRHAITNINKVQQDPSSLERHASALLGALSRCAIPIFQLSDTAVTDELFQSLSEIFYNFAKVMTWKRTVIHLRTDIFLLPNILLFLSYYTQDPHREANLWQANYFLLSWLYVLLISPFSFQQHHVDFRIIKLLERPSLSGGIFTPVVAKIRSELYYKNHELFVSHYPLNQDDETLLDLLALNDFLKKIERNPSDNNKKFLVESQLSLQAIVNRYLNQDGHSDGKVSLAKAKIMPKFLYLLLLYQDWSGIEIAISWYIHNMNSPITEFRFSLAHSFFKTVSLVTEQITKPEDNFCIDLVENRIIDGTIELLNDKLVDINFLHSNLLVMAELAPFIRNFLPIEYTEKIVHLILPKTFCFQQRNYSNKVSSKSSSIKDASNFVAWSLIRTTRFGADNKFLNIIFSDSIFVNLVVNSLFDRDFVIRKSSNAALQEYLGRVRGDHEIDNVTKIRLIELKIGNLTYSYENNLVELGRILGKKYSSSMELVLKWFIEFNILENYDLNIVCLSATSLRIYSLDPKVNQTSLQFIRGTFQSLMDTLGCCSRQRQLDRILYLLAEISPVLNGLLINSEVLTSSVKTLTKSRYHNTKDDQDFFKYLAVLKAWKLLLHTSVQSSANGDSNFQIQWGISDITFIFDNILFDVNISKACRWVADFTIIFGKLLTYLIKYPTILSPDISLHFWRKYYEYIKANNTIVCSSLPYLGPKVFLSKINEYGSVLNCPSRTAVLQTLIGMDPSEIIREDPVLFFQFISDSLDDHTVTIQGDIGSKVRAKACEFVSNKFQLIPPQFREKLMGKLLYLSVEPSDLVGNLALHALIDQLSRSNHHQIEIKNDDTSRYSRALVLWEHLATGESKPQFWRRYAQSGGSFHSVDTQLRDSVDSFVRWYVGSSDFIRQLVFRDIIEIIPTTSFLINDKKRMPEKIRLIVTVLNFLGRLVSSRVKFVCYDWGQVLQKFQDLVDLRSSRVLRGTIIQFLPFLALCIEESSSHNDDDRIFVNNIIRMITCIIEQEAKNSDEDFMRLAIESLLQLLIEFEQTDKVDQIQKLFGEEHDDQVAVYKMLKDIDFYI